MPYPFCRPLRFILLSLFLALSGAASLQAEVFELRTYTAMPGKLDALLARFRDHTCAIFERVGMRNVGYWTVTAEPAEGTGGTLIYILAHADQEAAMASWKAFQVDPEWQAARKASELDGKLLVKPPERVFLTATDFSPLR